MTQLKSMLLGGLFTLIMFFTITLGLLVATEVQPVQAREVSSMTVTEVETKQYARLTDATPQRDLTQQQFAP